MRYLPCRRLDLIPITPRPRVPTRPPPSRSGAQADRPVGAVGALGLRVGGARPAGGREPHRRLPTSASRLPAATTGHAVGASATTSCV
jgi:hypothetical protein